MIILIMKNKTGAHLGKVYFVGWRVEIDVIYTRTEGFHNLQLSVNTDSVIPDT
jgi:hypothetical protein